jgi:serine/threonine protein kinase
MPDFLNTLARSRSTPKRIGKYRIDRELGRGATSTVYLAHDSFLSQPVAVKLADSEANGDASRANRVRHFLQTEAALVGRLKHPHIVALLDADIDAEQPYVVMEYIEGVSLEAHSTPDTLLPVSEVLDIAFQCCSALEYALELGLVHRDIKPANMLLPKTGGLKLTDFGTAQASTAEITQVAGLVGSPAYMSPEQIREDKLTAQSDMFALGVVLYQLLTGSLPFHAETDFATIYKINYEDPLPPSQRRPGLGRELDAIVIKALAKKPNDRYASWREFAAAISTVCDTVPASDSRTQSAKLFQVLRGTAFLSDFPDASIWEVLNLGVLYRIHKDQVIMRERTAGASFYLLLEGRVAISRGGHEIAQVKAGETIGEMIYLNPNPPMRMATATAMTELMVLKIKCSSMRGASESLQGYFDKAFIRTLVERLTTASRRLSTLDDEAFIQLG